MAFQASMNSVRFLNPMAMSILIHLKLRGNKALEGTNDLKHQLTTALI